MLGRHHSVPIADFAALVKQLDRLRDATLPEPFTLYDLKKAKRFPSIKINENRFAFLITY